MKKALLTAIVVAFAGQAQAAKAPPLGTYAIDPMHSKVGFEVPHLVISTVEGTFRTFEGEFSVAKKFSDSKVEATIEIASIDTGVDKRDGHLRSPDFFDANKFPTMHFVSTKVEGTPKRFKMKGKLTMRGVTKPVTFDGRYLGSAKDGNGNLKAAFEAETKINRKDFGLTWNSMVEAGPVVGDEVTISLKIQGGKPVNKGEQATR